MSDLEKDDSTQQQGVSSIQRRDASAALFEEEEDEVQDWKYLTHGAKTTSSIPKRGEKEFEPDGTMVQATYLEESQCAMFSALAHTRGHFLRNKLVGVWSVYSNKCIIYHIRGKFFTDMGVAKGTQIVLNEIECLYLAERGSLIVYLGNEEYEKWVKKSGVEKVVVVQEEEEEEEEVEVEEEFKIEEKLISLDLEYLYCLLKVDIPKYQVYSYLKRLGYLILEHRDGESDKTIKDKNQIDGDVSFWLLPRQWGLLSYPNLHTKHFQTKSYFKYTPIFKAIAITHSQITPWRPLPPAQDLQITYDVWKPTPSFSKKNPPQPDFQLVVIDSSKSTKYLSFQQIHCLQSKKTKKTKGEKDEKNEKKKNQPPRKKPPVESKREIRAKRNAQKQLTLDKSIQLRNEYLRKRDNLWKHGYDNIIIAIENQGIINFIDLSKGNFSCLEKNVQFELDSIYPGRDHSIVYNEY
ncbi:SEN54 [Candida oxycetoniae]|uniref:SEN54 n=1 Tax=Candida oxycetoniae TaxID=497107 RepID=A0AAI9T0Q9_9ASCO|nr:SEN54 [Candida oxycetoniae]KAI3406239.2 SEN54 [Candida oxycetoniae]